MGGLNFLVVYLDVNTHDIREGNVTTNTDIWNDNIRSPRFWDIRKGMALRRMILRSVECVCARLHDLHIGERFTTLVKDGV